MRPRRLALASIAVVILALGGCGADDDVPPPPRGAVVQPNTRSPDAAIASIQAYIERNAQARRPDRTSADWRLSIPMRPNVTFAPGTTYVWTLETDVGSIQVKLRTDTAPEHAANAIYLALMGFYDGLAIHTIRPGRALETGDPAEDGKGGPGYAFSPETKTASHDRRGLVSAVSLGDSTDDSKFRITFGADASILPISTIFGDVERGLDVLKALEDLGSRSGTPSKRVTIRHATVSLR